MAGVTDTTAGVVTNINNWLKQPFVSTMSVTGWAAFMGLLIVLAIAWGFVLRELKL